MSLINIVNELVVENVEEAIKFYENNFKFEIEFIEGNPIIWAQLKKDGMTIMLEEYNTVKLEINNYPQKVNTSNLIKLEYSNTEEIKELYNNLKGNNIEFFMDYTEKNYGKVEFGVYDIDKNMLIVSGYIEK